MRRYHGEHLPTRPNIAVVANDALGNYVVSTPLLQMLRDKHPASVIHYFSGARVAELWEQDQRIDKGFRALGDPVRATLEQARISLAGQEYDLIVNVEWGAWQKCLTALLAGLDTLTCGPSLAPDGRGDLAFAQDERGELWNDSGWTSPELCSKYRFLQSSFIGEIFCRLAYLEGPIPPYTVPAERPTSRIPDVLIATAASLPEKLWPSAKWIELLQILRRRGLTVGLLGARPSDQRQYWKGENDEATIVASGLVEDLRGQFTLPEVVGALGIAKQVITLDNGILHLAVAAKAPTTGLFRQGISRLWAPPSAALFVVTPPQGAGVADIKVEDVTIVV